MISKAQLTKEQLDSPLHIVSQIEFRIFKSYSFSRTNKPNKYWRSSRKSIFTYLGLLLDFNVKNDSNFNSNSIQYYLKEVFSDVVAKERFVGAILKTTVFVLESSDNVFSYRTQIEAVIVNACWLAFLKHGVPMVRSIFQCSWKPEMTDKVLSYKNFRKQL